MVSSTARSLGDQLLDLLSEYVSRINAQSLLARALSRAGASGPFVVDEHNLPIVLQRLEASASLFIHPDRRASLQEKLRNFRSAVEHVAPEPQAETIPIVKESDIVVARTRARQLCESLGGGNVIAHKVATVVSELARNIVSYTKGGTVELTPSTSPRAITIQARDRGPGIPNLDAIMNGTYRSKTGLGLGLAGSKRLADDFHIDTGPAGTTVVIRMKV
jgi:serine/threonine-protein kinase RsbT